MTEDQYRQLCGACDEVLLARDASMTVTAIPWLHVIRAHPMFLHLYEELFAPERDAPLLQQTARLVRNLFSRTRTLIQAAVPQSRAWHSSHPLPDQVDVLIVSHLLTPAFAGQNNDFYFGQFANELGARKLTVLVVLINYTGMPSGPLSAKWAGGGIPHIVLAGSLDLPGELRMREQTCVEARRLKRLSHAHDLNFMRKLLKRAATEVRGGATLHALRLGEQIRKLVSQLSPKVLLTTYEGHSWERVAYAAAREALPTIRCIGYQHAITFNLQHAAMRPLDSRFNADAIVTAGEVGCDTIAKYPAMRKTPVEVVGSYRGQPARAMPQRAAANGNSTCCIVLPEGDAREYRLLFGFSLECATRAPDFEFIWRLHPNTRYEDLVKLEPAFGKLPRNITLSSAPLEQDIARAGWALYRGSTAVIQAVAGGAFPVYLEIPGELAIDTLYELQNDRGCVATVDSFLSLAGQGNDGRLLARINEIQRYCAKVFTLADPARLAAIISATASNERSARQG